MSGRAALAYVEVSDKMPLPPPEPRLAYKKYRRFVPVLILLDAHSSIHLSSRDK